MTDEHKTALKGEMEKALAFLSQLGNVADTISETDPDLAVAEKWNKVLDNCFEQIADFAAENGIEVE